MSEEANGIGMAGLTRKVLINSDPSGIAFNTAISTMLSAPTLIPVASRSKNAKGRFKFNFIYI
ncbi:hypothetical protein D9M68_519940 [compost metagenome]